MPNSSHLACLILALLVGSGCTTARQSDTARTAREQLLISNAVDQALAKCAEAHDPFARRMVAWSLRFWEGALVEPTLKKLAQDDGHGTLLNLK